MPRIARLVFPEIPHHITQRGNYQQNIFICDEDRVKYLYLVAEYVKKQKVDVLGYWRPAGNKQFIKELESKTDRILRVKLKGIPKKRT